VLLVPIGFLSDHTEVLYDLDVEANHEAQRLGLEYLRASTVMDHPTFVVMFSQLVQEHLAGWRGQAPPVPDPFIGETHVRSG
jgi:ferrochelatase